MKTNNKKPKDKNLKVKMIKVGSSSNISKIGYDKDSQTLVIVFKTNNSTYHYKKVPEDIFDKLVKANKNPDESVGSCVSNLVKGNFEYEKIEKKKSSK